MSYNPADNPLFNLLDQNNAAEKAIKGAEQHSMIMSGIEGRTGAAPSELTGRYYYNPKTLGYENITDDAYDEAVDADRNLGVQDMPVGLSGMKNRKRFLDISQSMLGLHTAFDMATNRAATDDLQQKAMTEFSDSGWVQMGRGIAGVLNPFQDVTGDTQRLLEQTRDALEYERLRDKDGNVVEFTPELYLEAITKHSPETAVAIEEYGITAESLKGITNYADATQALATKLWYAGQADRAGQQELEGLQSVGRFFNNLGNMIAQDPDMAAEIGLELAGAGVVTVASLGAAAPGYIAARIAARSGSIASKMVKAGKAKDMAEASLKVGSRLARFERYEDIARTGADWVATANTFKPGMSFGGNVAEWAAKRAGKSTWVGQNAAFAGGQLLDGIVGGAGARLRSNMYLQDEAMNMYGDLQGIELTDNMAMEGMMGAGFSLVLGSTFRYGGRALLNRFRADKRTIGFDNFAEERMKNAKTEQEQLGVIYGEDIPAGVKMWQARRNMRNQAMMNMSLLTGDTVKPEGVTALIGNLNEGIPTVEFTNALARLAESHPDGSLDARSVALGILRDKEFIAAAENSKIRTAVEVREQARLHIAQLKDSARKDGRDLELEALKSEGKSEAEAISILKARRKAEIEAKRAKADEDLAKAKEAAEGRVSEGAAARNADRKASEAESAAEAQAEADALAAQLRAEEVEAELEAMMAAEEAPAPAVKEEVEQKVMDSKQAAREAEDNLSDVKSKNAETQKDRRKKAADTQEKVDAEMAKRQEQRDRTHRALDEYEADVDNGKHGGAGGGDNTDLIHIKELKKRRAQEGKDAVDRKTDILTDGDEGVTGKTLQRAGIGDEGVEPNRTYSTEEVKDMAERRKEEIDDATDVVTDADIDTLVAIEREDMMAEAEIYAEAKAAEEAAVHEVLTTRSSGQIIDDPSRFRAPRVRTEAEAEAATKAGRQGTSGKYDREADLLAARSAEAKLASLMERGATGAARVAGREGAEIAEHATVSWSSLASTFKDGSLRDIDLEYVFGEAIISGKNSEDMLFDAGAVMGILQGRIDAIDRLSMDPDAALSPQQLRMRQADELAAWRKKKAALDAARQAEETGSPFRGASDAADFEAQTLQMLMAGLRKRGHLKDFTTNTQTLRDYLEAEILPYLGEGATIAQLGDGTIDFVHPTVAARALADVIGNNTNGSTKHKAMIEVENEETGLIEVRMENTDDASWISGVQPGTDREIAMILARMEYDYRTDAIAKHNFDKGDSVSVDEIIGFIEEGRMVQDRGRPLNREELALRAQWTPPQLRTNIVDGKPETIRERISRVKAEMMDMDATAYDLIHDDFGTRKGEWGITIDESEANGNWFANHGVAGGFPLASVMPNADGSYSFGMAVLDSHALLHPQTMLDTLASRKRGEAKAAAGEKADPTLRNVDGAQNGVRHAHALAMIETEADVDGLVDAVAKGTGKKRDFYQDLRTTTLKAMSDSADPMGKWWADSGVLADPKAGRKFAKKPVMILPYGAGLKSIRGSIESFLNKDGADLVAKMQADGMSRKELVDYLAKQWYGNKQEKISSLIREALELPEAEDMMNIILKDIARKDPMANITGKKTVEEQYDAMIEMAEDIADRTGMEIDQAFYALQIEARARTLTQADNISPEMAQQMARRQFAKEVNLVQNGSRDSIVAAAQAGELTFFERSLNALLRTEYHQSVSAQSRSTAAMTGQSGADFGLPAEANGNMFFQQLFDWRSRMVTPTTKEADMKGRKSRRGMLDVHGVMEESELVTFKTSEAEAQADIRNIDGEKLTEDEWFAKHIDEDQTIGSGVIDFRTHRGSKRKRLETRALALKGEALKREAKTLGIKGIHKMRADDLRAAVKDALIAQEETRIERLVVKAALAEMSPEFSPPLTRDASGKAKQLDRLTEDQKLDRWEAQSDDVRASSKLAKQKYDALDAKGKEAYEKSFGKPHDPLIDSDGRSMIRAHELTEAQFKEKEAAGDVKQTPNTMGGMLGSRSIHPTEATDMMLGVPALRAAAQARRMGLQGRQSEGAIAKAAAGAKTPRAIQRIEEGGDLFSTRERHFVSHTNNNLLGDVLESEEHIFGAVSDRYSPEAQDAMIESMLSKHAERYGLDDLVEAGKWGEVYAHRVWTKNIQEMSRDIRALEKEGPKKGEDAEAFIQRREAAINSVLEKWRKVAEEDVKKWEQATNEQWDAHAVDPFGKIKEFSAFGEDGQRLTWREAIVESAQRDGRGGKISRQRAGLRTNIDAIDSESIDGLRYGGETELPDAIEWRRRGGSAMLPIERADSPTDAPRQGFARSMVEDQDTGQMVDMDSLSDNAVLQVHYVHSMDRTAATGSVGMHMDESLLQGLGSAGKPYTVAEVRSLLAQDALPGAGGNIRFTMGNVEVVDGHMIGHNVRKSNSRNQNHWVLQNSQNRYVGDRLSVSALSGKAVKTQKSVWSRMDDRLTRSRHDQSALANETQGMLAFLSRKDPDAVDQSSFVGAMMDHGRYWNDSAFRSRLLRSHLAETEARSRRGLGLEVREIDNKLNINEIGNLQKNISRKGEMSGTEIRALSTEGTRTDGRGAVTAAQKGTVNTTVKRWLDETIPANGKLYSKDQVNGLIKLLKEEQDSFDLAADPRDHPDFRGISDTELSMIEELAGIQLMVGSPSSLLNEGIVRALLPNADEKLRLVGGDVDRAVSLANKIVEHNRKLRKLQQLATWDGVTGLGYTDIALRAYSEGKLNLDNPTEDDLKTVYRYWAQHALGAEGRKENLNQWNEGKAKQARRAIQEAKRLLDMSEPDPFTEMNVPVYRGSFVDQNGVKHPASYFMEAKNFRSLSDGHAIFDDFLESLLDSGTLKLPEVRMLRAVSAQMDGRIFPGIKFDEVGDLTGLAKKLGMEDPKKVGARAMSFSNKGHLGLAVLKDRLGRDLTAVDVVLHEIGHVSMSRLMAENSPELMAARSMASNPEGKKAMKQMVTDMHGGKWTQQARKAYDYYTAKGNEDEFLAAWFSYSMMARTLADRTTINAAYRKAGTWGSVIQNAMRRIANYAYQRVEQFARALQGIDGAYRQQMDSIVDAFAGKADMPFLDKPRDFSSYHASSEGPRDASSWRNLVDELRARGVKDDDPIMIEAKASLEDAIADALGEARAADFDPDAPGSERLREFHAQKMADEYTEDGVIDFDRMIKDDPIAAEQWMAIHILPVLQHGRYAGIPSIPREMAQRRALTLDAKAGLHTKMDNLILSQARAKDTVNSEVQLQIGDSTYSIMQLLAELADGNNIMSEGRLNGRPFLTLTAVSKALEGDVIRPMAILDDSLRVAVAKEQGSSMSKYSRALAERNENVQTRTQELRRLAGSLLLPEDTPQYRAAKKQLDELKARNPELGDLVGEMSDLFRANVQRVKRDAVGARLVGAARARESGNMPLRLKREFMNNKATSGGYGETVSKIYADAMVNSTDTLDIDTLIGVGILPPPDSLRTGADLADALKNAVDAGHLDARKVQVLKETGKLDEMVKLMKSGRPVETFKAFSDAVTPEGRQLYVKGVTEGDAHFTESGRAHINRRFQAEIDKSASADSKVTFQANSSGAELRALRVGRKVGSTSYFFGGDPFVSVSDLVTKAVDSDGASMFEVDVRVGSSALTRGIGLEAADSANMSKAFGAPVRGLSYKNMLNLLEKMSLRNTDYATKQSLENGLAHLKRSYEKLSGGLPTVDRTGNMVADGLARSATDLAMLTYGGNLGVAMLAETTATALNDIMPRFFSTPVKTMGMVWKSMTEGVSPIRKTQIARQLLFGMHVARDTVSARSIIRDTVDDLNPSDDLNFMQRLLKTGGSISSKASLAPTVQAFNKGFAAAGAMDDVLSHMDSAVRLRELLDNQKGVTDKKQFKELAKKAGFGRNWTLALRMQDSGLLDPNVINAIRDQANKQGAMSSRILDMDAMTKDAAKASFLNREYAQDLDAAVTGMRVFLEESIARNNVEPRVLDMKLVDNSGWNRIMDVFLAWPRAFYAQKSALRPGAAFQGGLGHLAGFYAGQALWDTMYTSLQGYARGEDPDEMLHQVETDPVGFFMHKAARMPMLGAWGSVGSEMLINSARNIAANQGMPGFGYHTRQKGGLDFGSSPVGSAMNKLATIGTTTAGYVSNLAQGTATFSMDDRQAVGLMRQISKVMPVANSLPAQVMREMFSPTEANNKLKTRAYYEVLQLKRQMQYQRNKAMAKLR